jgi:hypothetical protein
LRERKIPRKPREGQGAYGCKPGGLPFFLLQSSFALLITST